jgi:hypothetical protein
LVCLLANRDRLRCGHRLRCGLHFARKLRLNTGAQIERRGHRRQSVHSGGDTAQQRQLARAVCTLRQMRLDFATSSTR